MFSRLTIVAHNEDVVSSTGLFDQLMHRPPWQGLVISGLVLVGIYLVAKLAKLKVANRLLLVITGTILLGILFLNHNATVTALLLSFGFVASFLLTFTLLGKK